MRNVTNWAGFDEYIIYAKNTVCRPANRPAFGDKVKLALKNTNVMPDLSNIDRQ